MPSPTIAISKSSIFIQIVIGLVLILILYIISLLVLNTDSLVVYVNSKVKQNEKINIFSGKMGVTKLSGKQYNTINPYSDNFMKIPRSINDYGGAQFTYQFWMNIIDTDHANFKDLTILLKGDKKKYVKGLYDPDNQYKKLYQNDASADYMVKCPIIKFGESYKNMIIELNTNKDPSVKMEVLLDGPGARKNILSLSPMSWYLITYVIEDNFSHANNSENGIKISLYVNDFPYQEKSAATDPLFKNNYLRQNDGDLYIFPDITVPKDFMQLSDMKYYNYALSQDTIANTFKKGPSLFEAKDNVPDNGKNKPAFISAYNKIDIYNY